MESVLENTSTRRILYCQNTQIHDTHTCFNTHVLIQKIIINFICHCSDYNVLPLQYLCPTYFLLFHHTSFLYTFNYFFFPHFNRDSIVVAKISNCIYFFFNRLLYHFGNQNNSHSSYKIKSKLFSFSSFFTISICLQLFLDLHHFHSIAVLIRHVLNHTKYPL